MKTIDELLKEGLTPEHYRLIMKYYKPHWSNKPFYNTTQQALRDTINWSYTGEGNEFWRKICIDLITGDYRKSSNNIFLKL